MISINCNPDFTKLNYYQFENINSWLIPLHYYDFEKHMFYTEFFNEQSLTEFTESFFDLLLKYGLENVREELAFLVIYIYGKTRIELDLLHIRYDNPHSNEPYSELLQNAKHSLSKDMSEFLTFHNNYKNPSNNQNRVHQIEFSSNNTGVKITNPLLIEIIISSINHKLNHWNENPFKYGDDFFENFLKTNEGNFFNDIKAINQHKRNIELVKKKKKVSDFKMISNRLNAELIFYLMPFLFNETNLPKTDSPEKLTKEQKNFFAELLIILNLLEEDRFTKTSKTKIIDDYLKRYKSWRSEI